MAGLHPARPGSPPGLAARVLRRAARAHRQGTGTMTTHLQRLPLRPRIITFVHRVLNRLRFFPMTLVSVVLNALVKWRELRRDLAHTAIGDARRADGGVTAGIMAWLARVLATAPGKRLDACVRLPRE